ncbi:MAG: cation:proton antiporter [Spirochaetes bacterium RIFOXYC1_FULL_54_7]|nr:MAG: cation:proton antiporter [Spirochaetes bacterium RIFOXYC1_FULL_54_7]
MISIAQILYACSFALITIGLYAVLVQRNLIRIVIGLNIADLGVNILLVTLGYVDGGRVPIFTAGQGAQHMVDPIPQALVLTAIVIGFGVTVLMLTLVMRIYVKYGTIDASRLRGLKW